MPIPPAFDAPVRGRGFPSYIFAVTFGVEKLEWFAYPTVKNVEDMFIRFDKIHERDRRTERQTDGRADTA